MWSTGPDTRTSARSVARFTTTLSTPSTFESAFSTRPTHEAHVMPSTGRLIVVGPVASGGPGVRGGSAPGPPPCRAGDRATGRGEDTSIMATSLNLPTMGRSSRGRMRVRGGLEPQRGDPMGMRVDDMPPGTQEGDEGEAARAGKLDRECGGGRDRREQSHAEPRGLRHHLVACAAGDQDEALAQVRALAGKRSEQLVEGVVATDVLAHPQDLAVGRCPGGRVHRAGRGIERLAMRERLTRPL